MSLVSPTPPDRRVGVALFVAALVVYGATLGQRELWGEECFLAMESPWGALASYLDTRRWSGRPPLYYVVRAFSVAGLGVGPWGMRLPALLFGAAGVPATWLLARRVLPAVAARWAGVLLLLAALPGYYARESYPYSLSVLLGAGLGHVVLDCWRGPARPALAAAVVAACVTSAVMILPMAVAAVLLGGALLARRDRAALRRFGVGQAVAWGAGIALHAVALVSMRGGGGGLLDLGGGDANAGMWGANSPWSVLQRAVDGLVFGYAAPFGESAIGGLLPACAALALVAMAVGRGAPWPLALTAVGGFLGAIVPFWLIAGLFGHEHRLDARYFVQLAPLLLLGWVWAVEQLPSSGARAVALASLAAMLGWGSMAAQLPVNRAISEAAAHIAAAARPTDVGVGSDAYLVDGEACLPSLPLPRWDPATPRPGNADRVWVVEEKDEEDRFAAAQDAIPAGLGEAGFALAHERLVRPPLHEEFGQTVVLRRYDRGASPRTEGTVTFEVDLRGWPLGRSIEAIRVLRLDSFPLRAPPADAQEVARLRPVVRDGVARASVELPSEPVHAWEIVLSAGSAGLIWPPALPRPAFTGYSAEAGAPWVERARPALPWWPPLAWLAAIAVAIGASAVAIGALISLPRSARATSPTTGTGSP